MPQACTLASWSNSTVSPSVSHYGSLKTYTCQCKRQAASSCSTICSIICLPKTSQLRGCTRTPGWHDNSESYNLRVIWHHQVKVINKGIEGEKAWAQTQGHNCLRDNSGRGWGKRKEVLSRPKTHGRRLDPLISARTLGACGAAPTSRAWAVSSTSGMHSLLRNIAPGHTSHGRRNYTVQSVLQQDIKQPRRGSDATRAVDIQPRCHGNKGRIICDIDASLSRHKHKRTSQTQRDPSGPQDLIDPEVHTSISKKLKKMTTTQHLFVLYLLNYYLFFFRLVIR